MRWQCKEDNLHHFDLLWYRCTYISSPSASITIHHVLVHLNRSVTWTSTLGPFSSAEPRACLALLPERWLTEDFVDRNDLPTLSTIEGGKRPIFPMVFHMKSVNFIRSYAFLDCMGSKPPSTIPSFRSIRQPYIQIMAYFGPHLNASRTEPPGFVPLPIH